MRKYYIYLTHVDSKGITGPTSKTYEYETLEEGVKAFLELDRSDVDFYSDVHAYAIDLWSEEENLGQKFIYEDDETMEAYVDSTALIRFSNYPSLYEDEIEKEKEIVELEKKLPQVDDNLIKEVVNFPKEKSPWKIKEEQPKKRCQLRLQLRGDRNTQNKKKWFKIMSSDDKGYIKPLVEAKSYFLTLAQGNPRLAVFEWDEDAGQFVKIYQDVYRK